MAVLGWISGVGSDDRLDVLWPGASDYGFDLDFPLQCAAIQCALFAPPIDDGAPVPDNYLAAQVLQARALVRAGIVGDSDRAGLGETVAVFPMDWTVKNLLRPKRGKPYFGGKRAVS
ncbi:hypothetical protein [Micropruina sp.]|uniref:hypothetical protein n=1 Tax=Micropruina sp. TaxID=2737536 RepID=UPI0039E69221